MPESPNVVMYTDNMSGTFNSIQKNTETPITYNVPVAEMILELDFFNAQDEDSIDRLCFGPVQDTDSYIVIIDNIPVTTALFYGPIPPRK